MEVLPNTWRVSDKGVFCGTLRIARFDFDTDPSEEFKQEVYALMQRKLNARFVNGQQVLDYFSNKPSV